MNFLCLKQNLGNTRPRSATGHRLACQHPRCNEQCDRCKAIVPAPYVILGTVAPEGDDRRKARRKNIG